MRKEDLIAFCCLCFLLLAGNLNAQENWSLKWRVKVTANNIGMHYSPDGQKIVGYDGNGVNVYKATNGNLIWSKERGSVPVFSIDGNMVAYNNSYTTINLANAETGNTLFYLFHNDPVNQFCFSPDGKSIVSVAGNYLYKWDLSLGAKKWTNGIVSPATYLCLSNDGTKILTFSNDGSMRLWNSENGVLLWSKTVSYNSLDFVRPIFSPDDTKLINQDESLVQLWETSDGNLIWKKYFSGGSGSIRLNKKESKSEYYDDGVNYIHFTKDGSRFVCENGDGICVANTSDGSTIWAQNCSVYSLVVNKNKDRIVTIGQDKTAKIWDENNGTLIFTCSHSKVIGGLSFSADGKNLVSSGYDDTLKMWTRERLIKINAPNGGEKLKYPSKLNIAWTSQNVTKMKLEYSVNNKSSWTLIANNIPANSGSYSWDIPNINLQQCWVKVSDSDSLQINDTNDQAFQIFHPITITSPNGSEKLNSGATQNVTWIYEDVSNVSISYTSDNGSSWNTLASNVSAANKSYTWLVPNINSQQCKIKISDSNNLQYFDESDSVFTIKPLVKIQEGSEIPTKYTLYQNYPNPFNPSTIINYSIPKRSNIIIRVYDIIGREMATLLNEEKDAGNYSVKFDGSKLSSGIYFYQLRSGNFVETKKLLLMK